MPDHSHDFVETYDGLVGYGLDRSINEKTVLYYLQKFSDDALMEKLIPRLSDGELDTLFATVSQIMKQHLSENEYHRLFLKDKGHGHESH